MGGGGGGRGVQDASTSQLDRQACLLDGARTAVGLALAERLLAHGAPPLAADEQGHTTLALVSARRSVQRTRAKRPPSAVA